MIDAVVLAAGRSTRMGAAKPLLPIDGVPALARVLDTIDEAGIRAPIVVLGGHADAAAAAIGLDDCRVIENDAPEKGMARSLRLGLDAISNDSDGVLVFHADMPFVASDTVRAVVAAAEEGAVLAAPYHEGQRGFPVFFRRDRLPALRAALSGDRGGREYLAAHRDELVRIDVDDPGATFDLDRPTDVVAWEEVRRCCTEG